MAHDPMRRRNMQTMTPAELAIMHAVEEVEKVGADPRLTDAVCRLGEARESLADFIDGVKRPQRY